MFEQRIFARFRCGLSLDRAQKRRTVTKKLLQFQKTKKKKAMYSNKFFNKFGQICCTQIRHNKVLSTDNLATTPYGLPSVVRV